VTLRGHDYDDHERFDRPRRHTRPRTKDRPSYDDAIEAMIVTVDRGRFTCLVAGEAAQPDQVVTAMKSRPLGRKGVVVGDRVRLVGDVTGRDGTLARIVEVVERRTVLRRTADDDDPVERVIVANADQLVVVAALANPEPRPRLIDRALVAAYDAGLDPLLCLTKPDLADPETLLSTYRPLGVPHVVTERGEDPFEVRQRLAGRISVLVGHSGVGKSTLVNALVPGAERAIGHVNATTGRGRHTSTSVLMLRLPPPDGAPDDTPAERTGGVSEGWIVDTPGIRSFGLAHVEPRRLIEAFPDLAALTAECSRGCTHGEQEPECALDAAIEGGDTERARVDSFRRLLASRERGDLD
jgi:ribosome biogenesis GTPase